jgi:hypothetical protein
MGRDKPISLVREQPKSQREERVSNDWTAQLLANHRGSRQDVLVDLQEINSEGDKPSC